jgi:uncharacterized tellurite resistance protein B-like protein
VKPMTEEQQIHSFDLVHRVLANEERFKLKLGTGRDAFASIKAGDLIAQLAQVGSAAGAGAGAAVAVTAPSTVWGGIMLAFGMGSNPIGWIVGAAAASGGVYYGVSHLFRTYSASRVDEVPRFLNTGLDVLASTILDLLGSLALKIAAIDGQIDPADWTAIEQYFVEEWGYDADYLQHALDVLQQNIDKSRLSEMANSLAEFSRQNPDCDFRSMHKELRKLLTEIAEADGHLDEREEMAIQRVAEALRAQNSLLSSAGNVIGSTASGVAAGADIVGKSVGNTFSNTKSVFGALSNKMRSRK